MLSGGTGYYLLKFTNILILIYSEFLVSTLDLMNKSTTGYFYPQPYIFIEKRDEKVSNCNADLHKSIKVAKISQILS